MLGMDMLADWADQQKSFAIVALQQDNCFPHHPSNFLFAYLSICNSRTSLTIFELLLFTFQTMAAELAGGAFHSASLQLLFDRMASQQVVDFVSGN